MALTRLNVNTAFSATLPVSKGGTGVTTAADLANTGNKVLIGSASTTTDVAALELDLSTSYKVHQIYLESIAPATDGSLLRVRLSTDGGSSFKSGGGDYSYGGTNWYATGDSSSSDVQQGSRNSSLIVIGKGAGSGTVDEGISLNIFIYPRQSTSNGHHGNTVHWSGYRYDTSTTYRTLQGVGHLYNSSDETVDAIQFLFSSGDITYSSYYQYGIKG